MRKETVEALINEEKEIQGDTYTDMRPVLERTLTAGELLEALKNVDPDTPLLLEIAVAEVEDSQSTPPRKALALETAYLLNVFETGPNTPRLVLSGCLPEVLDFFIESEGL